MQINIQYELKMQTISDSEFEQAYDGLYIDSINRYDLEP